MPGWCQGGNMFRPAAQGDWGKPLGNLSLRGTFGANLCGPGRPITAEQGHNRASPGKQQSTSTDNSNDPPGKPTTVQQVQEEFKVFAYDHAKPDFVPPPVVRLESSAPRRKEGRLAARHRLPAGEPACRPTCSSAGRIYARHSHGSAPAWHEEPQDPPEWKRRRPRNRRIVEPRIFSAAIIFRRHHGPPSAPRCRRHTSLRAASNAHSREPQGGRSGGSDNRKRIVKEQVSPRARRSSQGLRLPVTPSCPR